MTKQKIQKKEYNLPKWFWATATTIVAIVLILVGSFIYWQSGWPEYLGALKECNNKPPVQAKSFIASTYINPGDDRYRIPGENGYRTYFCSENDAIDAGYKHKDN